MILALDIGNTNITIGCYLGKELLFISRMATDRSRMEDQYAIAKNAKLGVMPGGEVVMVMCEDSDTVYANIEKALK